MYFTPRPVPVRGYGQYQTEFLALVASSLISVSLVQSPQKTWEQKRGMSSLDESYISQIRITVRNLLASLLRGGKRQPDPEGIFQQLMGSDWRNSIFIFALYRARIMCHPAGTSV